MSSILAHVLFLLVWISCDASCMRYPVQVCRRLFLFVVVAYFFVILILIVFFASELFVASTKDRTEGPRVCLCNGM
jgi:hypothetical protein